MRRILRYAFIVIATFFAVSFLVFALSSLSPGDSSAYVIAEEASTEDVEAYRSALGLDRPFLVRYIAFIVSFIRCDWGKSATGFDISWMIARGASVTLSITLFAIPMALIIALPLSIAVVRKGGAFSLIVSLFSVVIMSLPSFLTAMILVIVFSIKLPLFPVAGYVDLSRGILPHLRSIFLPSLTLALLHASLYIRIMKKALKKGIEQKYSAFALSTGMKRTDLVTKSALKPSLPLLCSLLAQSIASSFGGAAVIETVFALPGLGSLMVDAALMRDARLAGCLMILVSLSVAVVFFIFEGVVALIDPRIRRGK